MWGVSWGVGELIAPAPLTPCTQRLEPSNLLVLNEVRLVVAKGIDTPCVANVVSRRLIKICGYD